VLGFVLRRLLLSLPALVLVSAVVFALMHLAPGDPTYLIVGPTATQQVYERTRERLGLDASLATQYWRFLSRAARGDLGTSLLYRAPVTRLLAERVPNTLLLGAAALLVAYLIGIPAGIAAALRRGSLLDLAIMSASTIGLGVPSFWLGLMLITTFAVLLPWFPASGYDQGLRSLLLPAFTIGLIEAAIITRLMRSSVLESLRADYVRTARAKGLGFARVLLHAVRNALLPLVSFLGLQLGFLLAGAVVVEIVFAWPGVGRLLVDAIAQRDFPVVQGVLLVTGAAIVLGNLFADVLYRVVDPRITYA
jgi:peptide/nickel transport system permease protein